MKNSPRSLLLLPLALAALAPSLRAGTPAPVLTSGTPEEFRPNFVVDLSGQYEFLDDSQAGPGGDTLRTRVSVPLFIPLSERLRVIGILRGGYNDFSSDPFGGDGFQTWNIGGLLTLDADLNDNWSGTVGVLGGGSWEDGASFSDSLTGGGLGLVSYRFSPTLKVGLGGVYLNRLNEDALIVPALGLDWQPTEDLSVTLYGLDLRAELKLTSDWSVYLRGEFDPDGALLKDRKGIEADSYSDQGFRAAGGLKWTPCPSFSLSVEGGVGFHEYTLRSDQEIELEKDRLDPSPFVGISARLAF
jgi:hypothetical protein